MTRRASSRSSQRRKFRPRSSDAAAKLQREFETRSLPRSLAAPRRGLTSHVVDPLRSIHEFTANDPTTDPSLMQFVTIRVIGVFVVLIACAAIPLTQIRAQTQAAMNAQARADFKQADAELNKTYQALLAKLRDAESKQKLKETQRAWITSRDAEAARAAKEAEGGSIAPTLRYETMTDLTRKRIAELKAMIDNGAASGPKTEPSPSENTQESAALQAEPTARPTPDSNSPDKKWEYSGGDRPKLLKASTKEAAIDFPEQCDLGVADNDSKVLWAPNSRRFAFYSCGAGKEHLTLLYQLGDDQWTALKKPGDDDKISDRPEKIIKAHAKREGLPKGTSFHMQWWKVEPKQWVDSSTLIVYASLEESVHRQDGGEDVALGFGADLLFTLKFDDAGKWKIVKTHEMTGKAAESPSLSTPLADEILYRSPRGNYRIQASVDGAALWIVPAKDPNRRKPLPGADPDNRSPEEFRASPDETWLFDNRQDELYRNAGDFAFSAFNRKQWFWKKAVDYASKEFHFARSDITGSSAGWSFDSARLLISFSASLHPRVAYFNTRTKAFEQTPYLRMVNTKLNTEKPYEAFPEVAFAGERLGSYVVFAEPIDPPPSEEILKTRLIALDQELNSLREKMLADLGTRRDKSIVEFRRSYNDTWNKARDEAVQLYLPFAPDAEKESRKLQFLCDLTQREVNGLREVAPAESPGTPAAQSASPAASPP